ncbi:winged helix DNA-binding protein [Candidatus Bathyarchaeota archaeon]|nr:winged helix DNA-binding protein [Candidatus Bathyarchaeota archaeon]
MPREHKEYRSKVRIYVDILTSIMKHGGRSGPTKILYGANLSYDRLMKHLSQLIKLGLVEEEKEGENVFYKLTDKGRAFLLEFVKIEKFAEAFGITI